MEFTPAGLFRPRGQNPRRQPSIPRVYTYKDKEYLLKKWDVFVVGEAFSIWRN